MGHFRHNHQVVKPGFRIFVIFVGHIPRTVWGHIPRTVWQVGNTEYRFPLYGMSDWRSPQGPFPVNPDIFDVAGFARAPAPEGHQTSLIHTYGGVLKINRAISTGQLHTLLRFHTRPINVVVFHGSQARPGFEEGFPLRCFQRLSRPDLATLLCGWRHNRSTRGPSTPVLSY